MDTWGENLVIICWYFVKNCIFEHITDKIIPVTGPFRDPWPPKMELLEPPLILGNVRVRLSTPRRGGTRPNECDLTASRVGG